MKEKEYAIEFLFDEATEKRILELYEKLEHAGFGLPEHVIDYHPHITLNVCNVPDFEQLEPILDQFVKTSTSFSVQLSHLGVFLTPYPVVFLGITINKKLLALHKHFIQETQGLISPTRTYYQPDHWVPHCTVAFDFDTDKLPNIIKLCSSFALPLTAHIEQIALVKVPQGNKLYHQFLSSA